MTDAVRIQRPSAEVRYADELALLRAADDGERPPGWALSLTAARRFVIGDEKVGVSRKFVGDPSLIDRALVTLATNRGLLLVGEPGTAKSLLSEILAAAVSAGTMASSSGNPRVSPMPRRKVRRGNDFLVMNVMRIPNS